MWINHLIDILPQLAWIVVVGIGVIRGDSNGGDDDGGKPPSLPKP
jgi:hypothetical protein